MTQPSPSTRPAPSTPPYRYSHHDVAPGTRVHLFPTEKVKTNRLLVLWLGSMGPDVTRRALLPSVLARGTASYPGLTEVTRRLEELYGASFNADVTKMGERHLLAFRFDFVNDGYLPADEAILGDVIDLAREGLAAPHLEDGLFPESVVAQEKVALQKHIEGLINEKSEYAFRRCLEIACADEEYRRYEWGDVADLANIGSAELVELWREQHRCAPMEIYFSGTFTEEAALGALAPLYTDRGPTLELPPLAPTRPAPDEPRVVAEEMDVNQSNLVLTYRTGLRYGDPSMAGLSVANGILGAFSHSKLFRVVREEHSLAYSVGSYPDSSQGLLFIAAGVPADKREQARTLIEAQLADVCAGDFTAEEFEATKLGLEGHLQMMEDNPGPLAMRDLAWGLVGREYDHEKYRAEIRAVTRDDVVEAARRIQLDTVYALNPRNNPGS